MQKLLMVVALSFGIAFPLNAVIAYDANNLPPKKHLCTYLMLEEKKIWESFDRDMLELRDEFIAYNECKKNGHNCHMLNNIETIQLLADKALAEWEKKHRKFDDEYEKLFPLCKNLVVNKISEEGESSLQKLKDDSYSVYRGIRLYQLIKSYR